jgi:hypothetical protein
MRLPNSLAFFRAHVPMKPKIADTLIEWKDLSTFNLDPENSLVQANMTRWIGKGNQLSRSCRLFGESIRLRLSSKGTTSTS